MTTNKNQQGKSQNNGPFEESHETEDDTEEVVAITREWGLDAEEDYVMEDGKEYHSSDDKEDVKIPEEEDQDEDINEEDEEP